MLRSTLAAIAIVVVVSLTQQAKAEVVRNENCSLGNQLNLPITEWSDKGKPYKAFIIAVHGLTLYAGAFDAIARHLAGEGYPVYALDMRGFGRWRQDGKQYNGDSQIHIGQSQADLLHMVQTVRRDKPQNKLFFLGESQGTNMALWVIENDPQLTNGAILASPCYHTRIHPSWRWVIDALKELIRPDKPINLEPYIRPYLTNDPVLTEKCDRDPFVNREMTPAELVKCLIENGRAIKEAGIIPAQYPILMFAGTKDGVFKSTGLSKEIRKFGDVHELSLQMLPGKGHLLIEHQPVDAQMASIIDCWLEQQTGNNVSALPK